MESWFNVAEGGKRGGKNVLQVLAFCIALQQHPNKLHLIAGVSQTTAKINILDCDGFGLINFFDGNCRQGKYNDRSCLYVNTQTGEKIILVSGGAKAGDEKYIKGNTYGMAYITEANECHPDFIQEVFDRTMSSADRKIFHDLNPKAERHWYYTDVLAYHERQQAKNNKYGFNYGHFTIADNLSIDNEKLKKILKTYQKGTVWYERDILGNRKTAEGIIFLDFANNAEPWIIEKKDLPKQFRNVETGFDIGGNGSAYAMTCTGEGYDNVWYILKAKKTQAHELAMQDLELLVNDFANKITANFGCYMGILNTDHVAVIINSINDNTKHRAVMTYKPPLEDRVFAISKLLAQGRLKFVRGCCDDLIDEMQNLMFDEKSDKAIPLDDGTMQIDTWDSFIYSMAGNWNYLDI